MTRKELQDKLTSKLEEVTKNHEKSQQDREMATDIEVLSDRQRRAIPLILSGKSDQAVADELGLARETICRWRTSHHFFIAVLNSARLELWENAQDRLLGLTNKAIDVIEEALTKRNNLWVAMSLLRIIEKQIEPCFSACDGDTEIWKEVKAAIPDDPTFDPLGILTAERRQKLYEELREQYLNDR